MARTRTTLKVETVQKKYLNKEEAMSYLGCSEDFLKKLRESAEVSFYQFSNKIWYDLASIDRFMCRNKIV